MRILQVVGSLNHGGVETWLVNVLDHLDSQFHFDFLVHSPGPFAYSERAERHGCKILVCDRPSNPLAYSKNFKRILRENGPYDVVHSHVHHFSGLPLLIAKRSGVPVRLCQSHLDTSMVDSQAKIIRRGYLATAKRLIDASTTHRVAVSQGAGQSLFKRDFSLFPCAIDPIPFCNKPNSAPLRERYGIPEKTFVIGHVGRFDEQKNHAFMLRIAFESLRHNPDMYLVLVGAGQLKQQIQYFAGLIEHVRDRTIFAGTSHEVPAMMRGLFDLFLFPSLYEGLPLAVIEAQAAGLPCVISDTITPAVDIIPELVCRVPIAAPPSEWSAQIAMMKYERLPVQISDTRFEPYLIDTSAKRLQAIYS